VGDVDMVTRAMQIGSVDGFNVDKMTEVLSDLRHPM
jgi:hypothetical protein